MNIGFIIYDSRSGSTFLSKQLHEFDNLFVTAESAFISRILDSKIVHTKNVSPELIVDFLYKEIHFIELKIDKNILLLEIKNLINDGKLTNKSLIKIIIDLQLTTTKDINWILIKHPLFEHLDTMSRMFQECKFIHLVRDPRGVHNSKRKSINLNGDVFSNNALKTSLKYRYKVKKVLDFEINNKEQVLNIRYCDLMLKNKETLEKCLGFLGVSNSKNNTKKYFKEIGINQRHLHTNVESNAIESKIYSWKKELPKMDIQIISYYCKDIIAHFNFEKIKINPYKLSVKSAKLHIVYILTSVKNFSKIIVSNPELVASKFRYLKTFVKR
ncbi:sulfotransferase [Mariniflexile litorale]|uniref:Sulfotransferase n=1 Tax=Mariniflexile litorale TaxID=3045158 RepID=A0AAU7EIH9_9FLAO|nr:sulfotransferase [Mariniflexile sp. KMM 9835]MDQ8209923.1 sulfotransferase [Mariniflexile sp. KMM 9835]